MSENIFIYLSNGFYFGFINNGILYSRDGVGVGWLEGEYVWGIDGAFKGVVVTMSGNKYVLRHRFKLPPISRPSRSMGTPVAPPAPGPNISPINLGVDLIDAFELR